MAHDSRTPVVRLENVTHRYNGVLALHELSLSIAAGSFTAILGPNGAGKSTLALIMGGMLRPTGGTVRVNGVDLTRTDAGNGFIGHGIVLVPEGRRLFVHLTVRENLLMGAYGAGQPHAWRMKRYQEVLEFLPELKRHEEKPTGLLSGGEQQMAAVARALMANPSTMILDEPSLGLAPKLTERVYEILSELNRRSMTVVVVEQIATQALRHASNAIIMDQGKAQYAGPVTEAVASEALKAGYLGH